MLLKLDKAEKKNHTNLGKCPLNISSLCTPTSKFAALTFSGNTISLSGIRDSLAHFSEIAPTKGIGV